MPLTSLRRAGTTAAALAASLLLSLGAAGTASAQQPADEPNGCTEESLHPEYRGQGLCEEPGESPQPEPQPQPQPEQSQTGWTGLLGIPLLPSHPLF